MKKKVTLKVLAVWWYWVDTPLEIQYNT